jgi:hypothetical protein
LRQPIDVRGHAMAAMLVVFDSECVGCSARTEAAMDTVLEGVVDELIRDNEEVRSTFDALCERGMNPQHVKEELARVFMGCLREAWHVAHPTIASAEMRSLWEQADHRFTNVLRLMRQGSNSVS